MVLALLALVSLCLLGKDLLDSNEAGKLGLALQQVRPNWNPHDWYLNTAQSYQWLFQQLCGQLLDRFGLSLGTLASRLAGYSLWAWATAALCRHLGLSVSVSLGAVAIFLTHQSLIAGEWMLGGAEPKTFAYGALLLAFVAWQQQGWLRWGFWGGLACSVHILVGGYGALALALAGLIRTQPARGIGWSRAGLGLALGALPIATVLALDERSLLQTPDSWTTEPSASWIYTYLRNPHHLVPSSWSGTDWWLAGLWLALFSLAIAWCRNDPSVQGAGRRDLALWSSLSLVPFGLGLIISLWDSEGVLLRFYPFRLADSLIPLSATLLLASQAERLRPNVSRISGLLLAAWITVQFHGTWPSHTASLLQLGNQGANDQEELHQWLRTHTGAGIRILTPPGSFEDLTLRTGRAGVAQFKQVPNRSKDVREWFQRMQDLGGDPNFWETSTGFKARRKLVAGFHRLSPDQLTSLANRYQAQAVITAKDQQGPSRWIQTFSNDQWLVWMPSQKASGRSPLGGGPQ